MSQHQIKNIKDLSMPGLVSFLTEFGHKSFRAKQIVDAVYNQRVSDFDSISNIPKDLKILLSEHFAVNSMSLADEAVSLDGTRKFLFKLSDDNYIESVLISDENKDGKSRITACISTQVGCPLNCSFCATGKIGFKRNLYYSEIIDQIIQIERITGQKITNIVYMGMGEPLLNLENTIASIKSLTDEKLFGLSRKRITISTIGVLKELKELADSNLKVKLAISLHATTEALRNKLIPYSKKYTITELMNLAEYYYFKSGNPITFEYVVIDGLNNTIQDVERLTKLTRAFPSKINLIPYHETNSKEKYKSPDQDKINNFAEMLREKKVNVFVRNSSGKDILAACGQLAGKKSD